jgi:hypothetical protein
MERAAKLLTRMRLADCVTPGELAVAAWPAAVGKKIAAYTRAVSVVRGRLVVEVADYIWQSQIWSLRSQIVANLAAVAGEGIVTELDLRLVVPRRAPQREAAPVRAADEADAIADPVLGRLYRLNRQRFGS